MEFPKHSLKLTVLSTKTAVPALFSFPEMNFWLDRSDLNYMTVLRSNLKSKLLVLCQ